MYYCQLQIIVKGTASIDICTAIIDICTASIDICTTSIDLCTAYPEFRLQNAKKSYYL